MAPTVVLELGPLCRDGRAECNAEASLPAAALIFCLATKQSAANPSEIRANTSLLALSQRAFRFPYRLFDLTIRDTQNFTQCTSAGGVRPKSHDYSVPAIGMHVAFRKDRVFLPGTAPCLSRNFFKDLYEPGCGKIFKVGNF